MSEYVSGFDFDSIIKKGLDEGNQNLLKKDRIQIILDDFIRALKKNLCEDSVNFYRANEPVFEEPKKLSTLDLALSMHGNTASRKIIGSYNAVFMKIEGVETKFPLFKYEIDAQFGFPVSLKYNYQNVLAENDNELVACLASIIAQQSLFIKEKIRTIKSAK